MNNKNKIVGHTLFDYNTFYKVPLAGQGGSATRVDKQIKTHITESKIDPHKYGKLIFNSITIPIQ